MKLPINSIPEYELTLPSNGRKIVFRQYLAKEQKLFQMAELSEDSNEKANLCKQVIRNCIITTPFNVDELTYVDFEFLMLHLRAKSVGDPFQIKYKCVNKFYDPTEERERQCNSEILCEVHVKDVKIENSDNKDLSIVLDESIGVGVKMKIPTFDDTIKIESTNILNDVEKVEQLILKSIVAVFNADEVFDTSIDKKDLKQFVDNLPLYQYEKITTFFDKLPRLSYDGTFTCPFCKFDHKIKLTRLQDFLA